MSKSCFAGSLHFCTNWFPITLLRGTRFLLTLESLLFANRAHFLSLALLVCFHLFLTAMVQAQNWFRNNHESHLVGNLLTGDRPVSTQDTQIRISVPSGTGTSDPII